MFGRDIQEAKRGLGLRASDYREPLNEAISEVKISKSRFIGSVHIVRSREVMRSLLKEISDRHKQATHNCWAYRIGVGSIEEHYSDDGEPSGTAGKPILGAILRKDLTNTLVVVTRYYGGIKLGVRGLIEAYGSTASLALESSGVIERVPSQEYVIRMHYDSIGLLSGIVRSFGVKEDDVKFEYAQDVMMRFALPLVAAVDFEKILDELRQSSRVHNWGVCSEEKGFIES